MNELNALYAKLLHYGLLLIRDALSSNDTEWAHAQAEMLHNIPSLIDEPNVHRHHYFWSCERVAYIQWVEADGREHVRRHTAMFYEPVWQEMKPILMDSFSKAGILAEELPVSHANG